MTNRYTTPTEGTVDWHVPLNENFEQLDRDVEIRDEAANIDQYDPVAGAKFFATDSGAIYSGDGSTWTLVGYAARAVGGDIGHYVNYADGLVDEPVNDFLFGDGEVLDVTRVAFPIKGTPSDQTVADAALRVYEGETLLVEIEGNDFRAAAAADSAPWVAESGPVTVTVTNQTGASIAAVPKVWANIRR
ncbi:hypothetical protein [Haloarcula onubensis]|uniref:hypothetical protein n=1 Tax=Haloarcula onubensis TaxID=2950539 RepID=UPI003AADE4B8